LVWSSPYSDGKIDSTIKSVVTFKRGTDLPNPVLFSQSTGAQINDVDQRRLGDCYFLESCSAAANVSQRIEDIFLTDTYNAAGIFAATVYIRGIPTVIHVDDYLPFDTTFS